MFEKTRSLTTCFFFLVAHQTARLYEVRGKTPIKLTAATLAEQQPLNEVNFDIIVELLSFKLSRQSMFKGEFLSLLEPNH